MNKHRTSLQVIPPFDWRQSDPIVYRHKLCVWGQAIANKPNRYCSSLQRVGRLAAWAKSPTSLSRLFIFICEKTGKGNTLNMFSCTRQLFKAECWQRLLKYKVLYNSSHAGTVYNAGKKGCLGVTERWPIGIHAYTFHRWHLYELEISRDCRL